MDSLANKIFTCFKSKTVFSLQEAYSQYTHKPKETVRARIYDNLGIKFERVAKGLYRTIQGNESCILLEGDGRDLSIFKDNSIIMSYFVNTKKSTGLRCISYTACLYSSSLCWKDSYISSGTL